MYRKHKSNNTKRLTRCLKQWLPVLAETVGADHPLVHLVNDALQSRDAATQQLAWSALKAQLAQSMSLDSLVGQGCESSHYHSEVDRRFSSEDQPGRQILQIEGRDADWALDGFLLGDDAGHALTTRIVYESLEPDCPLRICIQKDCSQYLALALLRKAERLVMGRWDALVSCEVGVIRP